MITYVYWSKGVILQNQIIHKHVHVDYNPLRGISSLKLSIVPYAVGPESRGQHLPIYRCRAASQVALFVGFLISWISIPTKIGTPRIKVISQYMKDKSVIFGITMLVAADTVSTYCVNFEIYVGKHDSYQQNIWTLIKGCHWTHKIRREKDNVYTSPQLVDYLFSRDTYLCGTVRTNWKGFPKPLVKSKTEQRRLQRGDFDWLVCGPLLASFWKNNRIVYYLSTFPAPEDRQLRTNRKNKSKDGTQNE